jgi:DNA repair protein RadC
MVEVVSIGTLSSSNVHPRETFRRAITEGSDKVIVAHNHPSGEVDPSDDDLKITKLLLEAGQIINIQLLDHIIFSATKAFSFKENKEI